jgi:hypothetical protein
MICCEESLAMAKQDVSDDVIYLRATGLNLDKRPVVACVHISNPSASGPAACKP